ncbi:MAG: fructose-specific PTS transporter subunit EIIC [Ruminococcus sp.]|nr:fructose-specific PTS transporter subunit EIIC [Ruminococcus sp.]
MKITDLLSKKAIKLGASPKDKNEAIDILVSLHEAAENISDKEAYKKGILEREASGSTAVGEGIAIPHAKNAAVVKASLSAMTVPDGVDYEALDGKPSNLFFMIAAPEKGGDVHLEMLSRLTVMLMDADFRSKLLSASDADEFLKIIDEKEVEKYGKEEKSVEAQGERFIVAVTACPTGIAHTFMAAEALEQAGEKLGIKVKVETNGSGGAKNVITAAEIAEADGVIIAADKNVDMPRFSGKKVLITKVSDGIHKPEELINTVLTGDVPVYKADEAAVKAASSGGEKEGIGRQIYKHLMNGVSNMLPFVVGGGILIALAFLIDTIAGNAEAGDSFGTVNGVAAWFKGIGNYAFSFMLPVLAGFIAKSIADRPGMMIGFAGGYIASVGATFNFHDTDSWVSAGFLGALLAGFIGGYLTLGLEKLADKILPKSLDGIKPVLVYPLIGLLLVAIVMCAIDPVVGVINSGLNTFLDSIGTGSKIFLGCVLGGMMSIDMGGPFNKAAYTFATVGLAAQTDACFEIMAAVMVGGMVPPIACAIGTTFFKSKYTEGERKSTVVNYILGLCFISEGAIPFAAADPLRVIPSCIVGSAIAGGMSMGFGCMLRAPHGGLFVLPVIDNALGYLAALIVGSVVAGVMMSLLKRKKTAE